MVEVVVACKSEEKGTRKKTVIEGVPEDDCGLVGATHPDCYTHRQVSPLAMESIDRVGRPGFNVGPDDFDENPTTQGGRNHLSADRHRNLCWKERSLRGHPDWRGAPQRLRHPRETGKCIILRKGTLGPFTVAVSELEMTQG